MLVTVQVCVVGVSVVSGGEKTSEDIKIDASK